MRPVRFIQSGDIHLGKPFGGYLEADRLRVARRGILARLAETARARGAPHVLVAGDLFETPNPAAQTWRQAAAEMADATDLTWWLLPGNHDNLSQANATWEGIAALGKPNLRVLTGAEPIEMQPGAWLLPAPLATRRPSSDPTAWMDNASTPDGAIRIGLAHGPIHGFGENEMPADIIAPDRDRRARLDWLALGDWHGMIRISERIAYAGSPEQTGFGHDGRGGCLAIELDGPWSTPRVELVETGAFDWRRVELDLLPGDDPRAMVEAALPPGPRRDMLVKVIARGRVALEGASSLAALESGIGPEFCHFEVEASGLRTEIEAGDLDAISTGGALREAADTLAAAAGDASTAEGERRVAAAALQRLHAIMQELDP